MSDPGRERRTLSIDLPSDMWQVVEANAGAKHGGNIEAFVGHILGTQKPKHRSEPASPPLDPPCDPPSVGPSMRERPDRRWRPRLSAQQRNERLDELVRELGEETDRGFVVILHCNLETLLNDFLYSIFAYQLEDEDLARKAMRHVSGFERKLRVGEAFGRIPTDIANAAWEFNDLRNDAAHGDNRFQLEAHDVDRVVAFMERYHDLDDAIRQYVPFLQPQSVAALLGKEPSGHSESLSHRFRLRFAVQFIGQFLHQQVNTSEFGRMLQRILSQAPDSPPLGFPPPTETQ